MKYEQLYKTVIEQGSLVLRVRDYPDTIMLVTTGFLILPERLPAVPVQKNDTEAFDVVVDKMLAYATKLGYKVLHFDSNDTSILVTMAEVVNRDYAVGFALGRGHSHIYDIAKKKALFLR